MFALYQQGNLPAAGQLAEQLLSSDPNNTALLEISGVVALQTGNPGKSAEQFLQQTRLDPNNALAHSNLCMALHTLGRTGEALAAGERAIHLDPRLADAWNNLGNIYKAGNRLEDALTHYNKALEFEHNNPYLYVNAGNVSQLLGDLQTAEQRYRSALRLDRRFAPARNNLGTVLQKLGRLDDAEKEFLTAIQLQPGNPEFLANMSTLMLERGAYKEAAGYLEKATQIQPDHIGSWLIMGNLSERLGDLNSARAYWNKVLEMDPENASALCNIGYQLFEMGEQREAINHFTRALKSNPKSAKSLAGLSKALLRQGVMVAPTIEKALALAPWDIHVHIAKASMHSAYLEHEEAISAWRKVITLAPARPEGYMGLAGHYAKMDRYEDAVAQYRAAEANGATSVLLYNQWSRMEEKTHHLDKAEELAKKALAIDPEFPGLKILRARLARRRKDYAAALEQLRQIDMSTILTRRGKSLFLFELGLVNDKLGNYREAFASYREANNQKNILMGNVYDPDEFEASCEKLRNAFSRETWPGLLKLSEPLADSAPQPVFIVGFPRSGTSLLEQILGSHPAISPAGELATISDIRKNEAGKISGSKLSYPEILGDPQHPLDSDMLKKMQDFYLSAVRDLGIIDNETHWTTDKMPHNGMHIGMIRLLFPKAPIIHITRHPLNPCLSAYFANFNVGHRYTSSLAATAHQYAGFLDMVRHYREIGIDFLQVRYEDLVLDQEAVTRRILEYIGAPWNDACLQHHKSERVVQTASYEQVTQKIYTSSLYRYQNYWDEVQEIIPILQPTIEQLGYTVEPPGTQADTSSL